MTHLRTQMLVALLALLCSIAACSNAPAATASRQNGEPSRSLATSKAETSASTPAPITSPLERAMPTSHDRSRAAAVFDEMRGKLRAKAIHHEVMLTVPAIQSCMGGKPCAPKSVDEFRVYYDGPPGADWWGPTLLWVDEAGAFWIFDAHGRRVLGFGRDRKVVGGVMGFTAPVVESYALTIHDGAAFLIGYPEGNTNPPLLYSIALDRKPDDDAQNAPLVGRGSLLRFGPDDGRVFAWSRKDWSTSLARISASGITIEDASPLEVAGRKLDFTCKLNGEDREGTLWIADKVHALPLCDVVPLFFAPTGEIYLRDEDAVWELDANGELVAGALIPPPVLDSYWPSRVGAGADGTIYAWIPKRHSIDFVRLELTPR